MRFRLLFILIFLLFSFSLLSQNIDSTSIDNPTNHKKISIAVLEFAGNDHHALDLNISEIFRDELAITGKYSVFRKSDMNAIFDEAVYPWMDCWDSTCALEIGRILGVQKVLLGNMVESDSILTITIQILNGINGKIENSFIEKCKNYFKDNLLIKIIQKICIDMSNDNTELPNEK